MHRKGPLTSKRWPTSTALFCYLSFGGMLAADALAAYAPFGIPVPWFAYAIASSGLLALAISTLTKIRIPPGTPAVFALVMWALFVQLIGSLSGLRFEMPTRSTSGYDLFIASRFLVMIGFGISMVFTYNLARLIGPQKLIRVLIWLGLGVTVAAIYIYAAQVYGFWEPSRTRMGTGGQIYLNQEVSFTYGFHRALGTFREPSHLAQWLIGPILLMAMTYRSARDLAALLLSVFVVLLSGSLLGLVALSTGIVILATWLRRQAVRLVALAGAVLVSTTFALQLFGANVPVVLGNRLEELGQFRGGTRTFAYEYAMEAPHLLLGYGVGNANLLLAEYISSTLIPSHLSLFLNAWHALGVVGLILITAIVLRPLGSRAVWRAAKTNRSVSALLASLVAWTMVYAGHAEELSVAFAVLSGLLWAVFEESIPHPKGTSPHRAIQAGSSTWTRELPQSTRTI